MKRYTVFLLLIFASLSAFSQIVSPYQVKGVVIDSTKETVIGAMVKLTSATDTILTSTNEAGLFSFQNVKSPNFSIQINSLGYKSYLKNYSNPNGDKIYTTPTIVLSVQSNILDVVVVDGTPTITYKTDTTEYRASDYNMKENATVEDLVKKMEGMEVDKDGTLTVQGETVRRARINGKDYFGGDVESALKDLPSEIVEKIQIIDDYGDEAARTGVKDGDPQKVINIVTKSNKRVGNRGRFESGAGSNDRYQLRANANRFNGNQQIGIQSNFNNTVTGIANATNTGIDNSSSGNNRRGNNRNQNNPSGSSGTGSGGGSGGTRQTSRLGFSYNDNLSQKVKLNTSYNFNNNNTESTNNSTYQEFNTIGTINGIRDGENNNLSTNHNFTAKLEYDINDSNWLIAEPTFSFRKNESSNMSSLQQSGALRQDQKNTSSNNGQTPNYGLKLNYGHRFNQKGTTVSVQLNLNNINTEQERDALNNIIYYDLENGNKLKDSLLHRNISTGNLNENYRGSLTFSHPLTNKSRVEFNGQVNYRGYDNNQITNVIDADGLSFRVDSLSRIFNYSFTESRFALNYKYTQNKYNFSLGMTAVPGLLKGYSESLGSTTHRSSFNLIPILRFEYKWTRQKRFSMHYTGNPTEPSYEQIQDIPDVTNPQNVVVGNPQLKAAFRHNVQARFSNYITNTKINYFADINGTFYENQIIRNLVFVEDEYNSRKRETRYVNSTGNYTYRSNYGISKRFGENKYNIGFNGSAGFNRTTSMNDHVKNIGRNWDFSQRLNFQIDPNKWLEVNPNIRYSYTQSDFSLTSNSNSKINIWAFSLSSKVYFIKTFFLNYDMSKNIVNGINANVSSNPFIINASLTKEFFKKRNGAVSLRAFDILNQNNFVNRQITENAIIDTRSNALSRYFMLSMSWTPQKWSGGGRNSGNPQRRGDGSYLSR